MEAAAIASPIQGVSLAYLLPRTATDIQCLLAENAPRWAEAQVGPNEPPRLWQAALGRVRQKTGVQDFGLQPGERRSFNETSLSKGNSMIDEVPVPAANQPDVGLQDDRPTARPQERSNNIELFDDCLSIAKMLEVIAHEDGVKVATRKVAQEI